MYGLAVLGAGAGGMGPLVWAAQQGRLASWLDSGIALVERANAAGGNIGRYVLDADSMGTSFLECLDAPGTRESFAALRADPVTQALERYRRAYPPLPLVGQFMRRLGSTIAALVAGHRGGAFFANTAAAALHLQQDGTVRVALSSGNVILARSALIALGGRQDVAAVIEQELRPGIRLADFAPDKMVASDRLMTAAGMADAARLLRAAQSRRIVVLGGSHSAFSAAWLLLYRLPLGLDACDLTILHRRPPRVFYADQQAAIADGYAVTERDICPATRRVHRLGGVRNNGRELWRRLTGRHGTMPEPRARMLSLDDPDLSADKLRALLGEAALVVLATGYRLRTVPVFDSLGRPLVLAADRTGPAVARDCGLRLAAGGSLPNVFGIGLGSGYQPWGAMGGEPGFDGQQNSLWLYQNDIGAVVYQSVQRQLASAALRRFWPAALAPALLTAGGPEKLTPATS